MLDWLTLGIGLVSAGTVGALALALLLSVPVVAWRAFQVVAAREWVPLRYNLRSFARRRSMTLMTFAVLSLVVFVLTTISMLAVGVAHTLESTGDPRNVKVTRRTSLAEWSSWLREEELQQLAVLPGVDRDARGAPLVSGELVVLIWAQRPATGAADDGANLTVRGVSSIAFQVHGVSHVNGRVFASGTNEIVIGKSLERRFAGAELGGTMTFAGRDWRVVGVVDHGGNAHDSEIWGDIATMEVAFKRGLATATVTLSSPASLAGLTSALATTRQGADLSVQREGAYWRSRSEGYVGFVLLLGSVVGIIFAFGAILGGLNTMYAQVAARAREIGTLRAIGFKPRAVLVSIIAESMVLSSAAGALGVLGASLLSSRQLDITTIQTLSEISYKFRLTPGAVMTSLAFACVMGYAGGILPALRAARTPIPEAVRAD